MGLIRRVAVCVLLLAATPWAQPVAAPVVLAFDDLNRNVGYIHDFSRRLEQDGYVLSVAEQDVSGFSYFGARDRRFAGSLGIFNDTVDGTTTLARTSGGSFALRSIDLAQLGGQASVNVTFIGRLLAGGIVLRTVTLTGPGPGEGFRTIEFGSQFVDVRSVSWRQQAPFHQFDRVVVTPLPATAPLLAVAALALAGLARRRIRPRARP